MENRLSRFLRSSKPRAELRTESWRRRRNNERNMIRRGRRKGRSVHQVQPPLHLNQTHRATLALIQGRRPQAQARIPVRALTVRVHGNGIPNAGGHERVVSPADLTGLKGSAAAAQGDDHSTSADGDAHPHLYCARCCVIIYASYSS